MEEKVFIRVPDVYFSDLNNWSRPENASRHKLITARGNSLVCGSPSNPRDQKDGKSVVVTCNEVSIALFRVDDKVYAVQSQCPHAGGPLHMGDIEELPGEGPCVKCPWHNWRFQLSTGKVKIPRGRQESSLVFPVKVKADGSIYVGFDKFSNMFFDTKF
ncbi:hypothetical protein BaRGS_00033482 [Batillaria attramentaria]|uniref:Rieske domain-containing protein n=1 Tax=Batillaria attramentaria TaxID=370345 RepID=A0ABD0JK48_9CAEN